MFGIRTPCTTTGCFISSSTKSQMATSAQNVCPFNKMTYIISITMKVFYIWPCYWHDQNCAAISLPHQHLLSRRMGKQSRKNVQVIQFGHIYFFEHVKQYFVQCPNFRVPNNKVNSIGVYSTSERLNILLFMIIYWGYHLLSMSSMTVCR